MVRRAGDAHLGLGMLRVAIETGNLPSERSERASVVSIRMWAEATSMAQVRVKDDRRGTACVRCCRTESLS